MVLSPIDVACTALSIAGEALVFAVMLRGRIFKEFPIFFGFISFSLLCDCIFLLWLPYLSAKAYFVAYFATMAPGLLLQLGVLFEVARNVLNPVKHSLPTFALAIFAGMVVGGTVLACFLSSNSAPAHLTVWAQYFVQINFTAAILQLAIFSVIVLFSQMLGIGWKNHVMQIATGFAGYCIVALLVELLHRFSGVANDAVYHLQEQFRIVAWCLALGYWRYALAKKEAPRREFGPRMANFLLSIAGEVRQRRAAAVRVPQIK